MPQGHFCGHHCLIAVVTRLAAVLVITAVSPVGFQGGNMCSSWAPQWPSSGHCVVIIVAVSRGHCHGHQCSACPCGHDSLLLWA